MPENYLLQNIFICITLSYLPYTIASNVLSSFLLLFFQQNTKSKMCNNFYFFLILDKKYECFITIAIIKLILCYITCYRNNNTFKIHANCLVLCFSLVIRLLYWNCFTIVTCVYMKHIWDQFLCLE